MAEVCLNSMVYVNSAKIFLIFVRPAQWINRDSNVFLAMIFPTYHLLIQHVNIIRPANMVSMLFLR